jgi:DNA-binding SARP family transcriptional activator/tetratricopeptide (TPR) repeat protein
VRVRLLGPLDVVVGGAVRPVSGLRRKAILAVLSLRAGEIVSTDRLADIVWGDCPPSTPLNTLQSHVSHLRTVLGSRAAILARPPGYVLDADDVTTDMRLAERLLHQATRAPGAPGAPDPARRIRELREALALWRGRPLADLAGIPWLEDQAHRLDLLQQQIRHALAEARLAAGEHTQLLPDLDQLAADHPLDERIHGQLMVALYRSGRQADALAAYRRLRITLNEQLGIDPGQALRDLETAILRQDASLSLAPPVTVAGRSLGAEAASVPQPRRALPAPAQLPPSPGSFAGRDAELASLDAMLPGADAGSGVVIATVTGTAGVGKTALALHWAHRARERFPDGQLYVDLRGFDPNGPATDPDDALRGFLGALGVPPERVPDNREAKAGFYRSLLNGKRMLVVLDNARDAEQARPLLPGSSASMVLVTSRSQLTGLVAAEGARPVGLCLLTVPEAYELLALRLGECRVAAERQAAEEIIASCARLPLALTIAAARAAERPSFPLTAIAAELRDSAVLDPFDGGVPGSGVRAAFAGSYRALSTDAARLFRLLALHPGRDISLAAAASLLGAPPGQARKLLAELARAHLLGEHSPGRFACHELLRAYAAEQTRTRDDADVRIAALRRVLDHFLHTSYAGTRLLEPYLAPFAPAPPLPGVTLGDVSTACRADDWFAIEYPALLTAVTTAADARLASTAWQLAWTLTSFQLRQGYWDDHALAQQAGLNAARRAGDQVGEAHALLALGIGYSRAGRGDDAEPMYARSLRLLSGLDGYLASQALIHTGLMQLSASEGCLTDALRHAQRARAMHLAGGYTLLAARALNDVGYCHALAGNYRQAIAHCELSLAQLGASGEPGYEAPVWRSLGFIYYQLGSHRRAIDCYDRSLELSRTLCDRFSEADTLGDLGDVYHSAGDPAAARHAWARALRVLKEIDHPDAGLISARLADRDDLVAGEAR